MQDARPSPLPPRALVGMVHLGALPGTPRAARPLREVIDAAVAEARLLADAGFDALLVENMHDTPYLRGRAGPEIVAAMTAATGAVAAAVQVPVGVQVLAAANREALAVALAAGAAFIRAEGFVFAGVADEGLLPEAAAGPLLRERARLGAEAIAVFADIRKKHTSHAITADLDTAAWARGAAFFGADGLIVTGSETGMAVDAADLDAVRGATRLPLLVGSGATAESLPALLERADGVIVGSALKRGGCWSEPVDRERVARFVAARR